MPATFRTHTTSTTTPALPSGAVSGDIIVVVAYRDNNATPPTLPTDWTNIIATASGSPSIRAQYRVYDGSWSMPTFTNATRSVALRIDGQDTTTPIGNSAVTGPTTNATVTFPAFNTTFDDGNSLVIQGVDKQRVDSFTSPAGITTIDQSGTRPMYFTGWDTVTIDPASQNSNNTGRTDAHTVIQFEVVGLQGTAHTQSPTDSVGITDSVSLEFGHGLIPTDSVGITDSVTFERGYGLVPTDNVGITDSIAIDRDTARTDNVGVTDSVAFDFSRTLAADPVGITDSVIIDKGRFEEHSNPVGITDSVAFDHVKAHSDLVSVSDSVSFEFNLSFQDSVGITDSTQLDVPINVNVSDSVGITDSVTIELAFTGKESFLSLVDDKREIAIAYLVLNAAEVEAELRLLSIHDLAFKYWSHKAVDYEIPTVSVEDHMVNFDPTKGGWEWLTDIV